MNDTMIYHDIAARTDGAFLLGVVGPVRTGKSSFVKRFMETLVIPRIENTYMKERTIDGMDRIIRRRVMSIKASNIVSMPIIVLPRL